MKLVLRDIDPEVVLALTEAFGPHHNVSVGGGDLLNAGVDAVVVPIQGVSTLDDGFVASCRAVFRTQAWSHLTVVVQRKYHGSIPVGEAVLVSTGLSGVKWMIAAPARHADEFVGLRVQGDCLAGRVILPGPDRNLASSKDQLRGAGAMTQASSGQSGASMRDPVAGARLALLAALRIASREESIRFLGCPGLGAGSAGGDPWACAEAMRDAWLDYTASPGS